MACILGTFLVVTVGWAATRVRPISTEIREIQEQMEENKYKK